MMHSRPELLVAGRFPRGSDLVACFSACNLPGYAMTETVLSLRLVT